MASSGISNVVIASVHSEKTSMKKLIIIIIIMKKSQETTAFSGHQNFRHEIEARKVIIDFKFDALYW